MYFFILPTKRKMQVVTNCVKEQLIFFSYVRFQTNKQVILTTNMTPKMVNIYLENV